MKDRAALGIIEAAEVDGQCVCLFVSPPMRSFLLRTHTWLRARSAGKTKFTKIDSILFFLGH